MGEATCNATNRTHDKETAMPFNEPSRIQAADQKARWLKWLIGRGRKDRAGSTIRSLEEWRPRSRYLTDGRELYRVLLLDVPTAAVILENCRTLTERFCTSTELCAMHLREVV
jgi:hypothetical protein